MVEPVQSCAQQRRGHSGVVFLFRKPRCLQSFDLSYEIVWQPEKSEGRRAFDLLFDSVKRHKNVATRYIITRTDFKNALLDFMKRRSRLTSALENWENLTIVINSLTVGIFWFIMIFVVSTIYGFDLRNVLVTLSTFVLSIAFAFGPTMAKMIESVIFIFASQPYDVGDRVSIDGQDYHVSAISLLTTQFRGIDNRFADCQYCSCAINT